MTHNLKFTKLILKNIKSGLYNNICPETFNIGQLFKYLERFDIIDNDLIYYRLIKNKCDDIPGIAEEDLGSYLHIPGNLYLYGTKITSLPDGLTVGGYLDLHGTNITSLPDGLTVGGYLDLYGTKITSLPDGLTVGGSLNLRETNITSLPDGLTVGGYLYLQGTKIKKIPDDAIIKGKIYK